jgi:hypothetical protein
LIIDGNGIVVEYWDLVSLLFGGGEANTIEKEYVLTPRTILISKKD